MFEDEHRLEEGRCVLLFSFSFPFSLFSLSFLFSFFLSLCHSLFSLIPSNLLLRLIIDLAPPFPTLQSFLLDTPFCSSLFFPSFLCLDLFCWTVVSGCSRTNISWRGEDVAVPATVRHLA